MPHHCKPELLWRREDLCYKATVKMFCSNLCKQLLTNCWYLMHSTWQYCAFWLITTARKKEKKSPVSPEMCTVDENYDCMLSSVPLQGCVSKTWFGQLAWFSMSWTITALERAWRPVVSKLRPSRQVNWQELQDDHSVKWQSPVGTKDSKTSVIAQLGQ